MNLEKNAALLDVLKAACSRQFRFNPRRVEANMRYKGTEGHGSSLVQVFRDSHTHSQIELKGTQATLREQRADDKHHAHWDEAEKTRYQHTDAEIDAEIAEKKAILDYTTQCQLYLTHREYLLSHYKEWPSYQPGRSTAREAARALLLQLSAAKDANLTAYMATVHTTDVEALSHLILAPCHIEMAHLRNPSMT